MKKITSLLLFLLLIAACNVPRKTIIETKTESYTHSPTVLHPEFVLFHVSDSVSELHFDIQSKELLYTRPDGINFSSNVLIAYRLLPFYNSKEILDSSSVRLTDVNNGGEDKSLIGKINIKAKSSHSYFLRITIFDLNRNTKFSSVMEVEKENDLNRQNFLIKSKNPDVTLFRNYIKTGEEIIISYKAKIAVNLYVRYYNREFPLAAPPFSLGDQKSFQYRADSTFSLQLSSTGSVNFTAQKKGFYHFQLDTSKRDGITLFNFSETFPEVKKADDLVPPLRFITSQDEYDELRLSTNKKAAIEKFWVNCTGNQDRAKEVIRKYYNRVQDANLFFTSFLEGWKTDRGMTYLIFGSPNVIYKEENSETWIYGEENNISSLSYSFSKVDNPFTDNDFILERSPVYKQSWYSAVDIWRQGRVYLQD